MSVTLHTTHGDLKVEIFCEAVPKTAENFLALCASGAYTETPFHRLIPTFMIQGGDISLSPVANPSSQEPSPILPFQIPKGGTSIHHPTPLQQEIHLPSLRHNARGILSMASRKSPSGARNASGDVEEVNGSQFFITFAAAPHLDGKSTVFGKVLDFGAVDEGGDTLTKLEKAKVKVDKKGRVVQPSSEGSEEGWEAVRLERVTIHANPFAPS